MGAGLRFESDFEWSARSNERMLEFEYQPSRRPPFAHHPAQPVPSIQRQREFNAGETLGALRDLTPANIGSRLLPGFFLSPVACADPISHNRVAPFWRTRCRRVRLHRDTFCSRMRYFAIAARTSRRLKRRQRELMRKTGMIPRCTHL